MRARPPCKLPAGVATAAPVHPLWLQICSYQCLGCVPLQEDTPGAAALRFKVSLGGGARRSGPLQPPSQQDEHTARLQQKYGIEAEAARRLLPLDRDAAATGALLRDFCCAMLRVASGRAVPGEQPRAAKLASEENEVGAAGGGGAWEQGRALPNALHPPACCPGAVPHNLPLAFSYPPTLPPTRAPLPLPRTRCHGRSASATRCGSRQSRTPRTERWR